MNRSKRKARWATGLLGLLALAVASLSLAACGGGSTATSGEDSGGSGGEISQGGVLRWGLEGEPTSLYPPKLIELVAGFVTTQIFESPLSVNAEGEVVPNLATSYKVSSDNLTWTLQFDGEATFSTGKPVTAEDAAFSFEQAMKSPYHAAPFENVSKVTAPSPKTMVIKLSKPTPPLSAILSGYGSSVFPSNFGGVSEKEFEQHPIGTGPYELTSWKRGQGIKLGPNKHYWKSGGPYLDEIDLTAAPEESSRLTQLRGGDLDFTKVAPVGAKTGVPDGSGIGIEASQQVNVDFLLLNQNQPLFKDPKVREAVNLAMDREGIIKTGTDERGELGAAYLPPAVPDSLEIEPPARDVEKAKSLIAEAEKSGVDTSFTINYYSFESYGGVVGQILQQDLEEIGLHATVEPLDEAAMNEAFEKGDYDAAIGSYSPAYLDPSELTSFYLAFYAPGSGADVPAQTKLAEEAANETDPTKRSELYAQLQEIVNEDESLLVLDYQPLIYALNEEFSGVQLNGTGLPVLTEAALAK